MNLYEFEGKELFTKHGIAIPQGVDILREGCDICFGQEVGTVYQDIGSKDVVVKAQVLSGKRGKNNGIKFSNTAADTQAAVEELFGIDIRGQYVAAVRVEEKLDIAEEHYLSITYDTNAKQPVLVYSQDGGMDIEDVDEIKIKKFKLKVNEESLPDSVNELFSEPAIFDIAQKLWQVFLAEDCRLVEINPLVKTKCGSWIAADAKVALDDDAFYRHKDHDFMPRTMMGRPPTGREVAVADIDKGEKYYQGTAGKYIEMDGDIAILFSGGGASIANMDALIAEGLSPANYTEYSGNPPREKVYQLAKIVLSKPGLRGLWIAGGVANFTNVKDTFEGIVDALDEVKPTYPIVVRRAGPYEEEGMALMEACAKRNGLDMTLFGKEMSMGETAKVLAKKVT